MNTGPIKTFAQQARLLFREGVRARLTYWGFRPNGKREPEGEVEATRGGYIFRAQVYNDPSVPAKWQQIATRITDARSYDDLLEEAAYSWFNRMIALLILERNGYEAPSLGYLSPETRIPHILQDARRGDIRPLRNTDRDLLQEYLLEEKEWEALALLLADLSNRHELLKAVFGRVDDYTELLVPANLMQRDGILDLFNQSELISQEAFEQVELLGWLYQFYISDKKDEVFAGFKRNQKARPQDIPAATQIFTPRWIVSYMVENTLGKLWLEQEPDSPLREQMTYLVEANPGAAREFGTSDGSARTPDLPPDAGREFPTPDLPPEELKLLDPAAGSGHILVVAFDLLMQIYKEAGHSSRKAAALILQHNLYGLDLDLRAAQLARFALLLKAAAYDRSLLNGKLLPQVHAMPQPHSFSLQDIQSFLGAEGEAYVAELREALDELQQAHNIGSALKLSLSDAARAFILQRQEQAPESSSMFTQHQNEHLQPFLHILLILTDRYPAVVANPPYMGSGNMNAELKKYVSEHYKLSKSDLFAVFMEVCWERMAEVGKMGMINQQSWMFLSSYEKLRDHLLGTFGIENMLHLGPRTFDEISGEVVNSTAFVLNSKPESEGNYYRLIEHRNSTEKEMAFLQGNNRYSQISQSRFAKIPGSPIAYWVSDRVVEVFGEGVPLREIAKPRQGLATTNNALFLKQWPEVSISKVGFHCLSENEAYNIGKKWFPVNKGGSYRKWYGNNWYLVNYENKGKTICDYIDNTPGVKVKSNGRVINKEFYFRKGMSWSSLSSSGFAMRYSDPGFIFETKGSMCFADKDSTLLELLGYSNSKLVDKFLGTLSPTLDYHEGPFGKIPCVLSESDEIIRLVLDSVSLSRQDWDAHETSWDFIQSLLLSHPAADMEASYAAWEAAVTRDFYRLHAHEEELNRIFIGIYGLEEELTSTVELKDVTILQEELDRGQFVVSSEQLAVGSWEETVPQSGREQGIDTEDGLKPRLPIKREIVMQQWISYCVGVIMGRYRLDKPGLHIAHPSPSEEELAAYAAPPFEGGQGGMFQIDLDAIVPMLGSDSPFPDELLKQVTEVIRLCWGDDSLPANLNFLQAGLGMNLEKYLATKFWDYHKRLYKKRPIYWLFQSPGKHFQALVYMHRISRYTLQELRSNYLHPYQEWLTQQITLLEGQDSLPKAEQKRLDRLRAAQLDCRAYDETLKGLAAQQIEIDLDDGVTVNIAKFEGAVAKL